ncbi:hypothetical protein TPHA_0E03790 [Tetrapisispora phaffii CBS 4417]|uniref:protein disulfide-isomerase n=1 Tax=Tetrapisispora phaffii (strain ATCC 24235 / CBS 4417 / NBRC 1672 / NRRL Y-8282 / UCD 70-5) TaxID=1071381 RepID=G8BU90_TETPH|nr:hypothetical protein TPHA_0E03790 [Tetrapisispora phaffii CBS 4417]CCE63468.1 hypothetical protein TPHA_0E03790 [Tetrapisispora phaffii CBS 4417]
MVSINSLLLVAGLSGNVFGAAAVARDAKASSSDKIEQLNATNFDQIVGSKRFFVAEFYAPWCLHSKNIKERLAAAADRLLPRDIVFGQIDCTENKEVCDKYEIDAYPTLKIFKDSNLTHPIAWEGSTNVDGLVAYALRKDTVPVTVVDSESVLQDILRNSGKPVVVKNANGKFDEQFENIAKQRMDSITFVSFPREKDATFSLYINKGKNANGSPDIKEISNLENLEYFINDEQNFVKWITQETLPAFGNLTASTHSVYASLSVPIAYYMYNRDEDATDDIIPFMKELGETYRGKVNIVGVDVRQYSKPIETLGVLPQYPLFAIHDVRKNRRYVLPQLAEEEFKNLEEPVKLSQIHMKQLLENFTKGEAKPMERSEEVPAKQDSDVYHLVGSTHDKFVFDEKRDILVRYYAPWCNISAKIEPLFNRAAQIFNEDASLKDKLALADINAFDNDVLSVDIEQFPTLVLFPAGNNTKPVFFEGGKSIESIMAFVENSSTHKIPGKQMFAAYRQRVLDEQNKKESAEKAKKASEEQAKKTSEEQAKKTSEEQAKKNDQQQQQQQAVHDEL